MPTVTKQLRLKRELFIPALSIILQLKLHSSLFASISLSLCYSILELPSGNNKLFVKRRERGKGKRRKGEGRWEGRNGRREKKKRTVHGH
jgi:hypothetical protein